MERTLSVTGKGQLAIKPDTIRLLLDFEGANKEYEKTVEQSAKMSEEIKELFAGLGFDKKDLKTLNFNVNTEYESYQDENHNWKKRFKGFRFVHNTKIEFAVDNELLGKVMYALAHASLKPTFRIEYTVADCEKAENDLIALAVKDACQKAEVLAKAGNVELGDIFDINYSWSEIDLVSRPVNLAAPMMMKASMNDEASCNIDVEPDDIKVSDEVTVRWFIK